ncbi:uncharacterized protein [Diadema setosum]|uniref:uncharacterized protein n=1 Tax=Diadema setosum TaxID=31175 RepID=UPI003B3AA3FB
MASEKFSLSKRRSNSSPQLQCEATDFSSLTGDATNGPSSVTPNRTTCTTSWSESNASVQTIGSNVVNTDVKNCNITTASVHWLEPKQRAVHHDEPVVVKPKALTCNRVTSGRSQPRMDPDMLRCNETIHYLQGSDSDSSTAGSSRRKAYRHKSNSNTTFKKFSKAASQLLSKLKIQESHTKRNERAIEGEGDSDTQVDSRTALRHSRSFTSRMFRRFSRRDDETDSSESDEADRNSPPASRKVKHRAKRRAKSERGNRGASKKTGSGKQDPLVNFAKFDPDKYPIDCVEDIERAAREREIEEGIDASLVAQQAQAPLTASPCTGATSSELSTLTRVTEEPSNTSILQSASRANNAPVGNAVSAAGASHTTENIYDLYGSLTPSGTFIPRTVHTQIDYMHCLVPDQWNIMKASYYWGKIDRYEADNLLENKPEGTFLLRDSAQEEFLFSVSFCRYGRTLHARIEQWNHKFSFDAHDPGVYSSDTICGLLEHYKDPNYCMFFEPMLTNPLPRINPPSLQELARARICQHLNYDSICYLELPNSLKEFLRDYHYKQRIRIRRVEVDMPRLPKTEPSVVTNTCISR